MAVQEKVFHLKSDVETAIANNPDMKWYIVQTAAKCEDAFSKSVMDHLGIRGLLGSVGMVLIPRVKKVDVLGKERVLNSYPSYVFILANMSADLVHCIKGASKVMGFIGDSSLRESGLPNPITTRDINQVMAQLPLKGDVACEVNSISIGDKVVAGDMKGVVKSINKGTGKAFVTVYLFGKECDMEVSIRDIKSDS